MTRTGGAFADVSVKFKAVPITAVAGEKRHLWSGEVFKREAAQRCSLKSQAENSHTPVSFFKAHM